MIILDTSVISQFMGAQRDIRVKNWMSMQSSDLVFTTAITIGEIQFGIDCVSDPVRRSALDSDFRAFRSLIIGQQILAFDQDAALEWALLRAEGRRIGRERRGADAMIAGIALAHGFSIATRNVKDFEGLGVQLINPFEHGR